MQGRLEWIPSLDMAYTFQSQEKKGVMARMKEVVNGDVICAKVYAVFSKLGFDSLNYLSPIDQSTLCTVRTPRWCWLPCQSELKRDDRCSVGNWWSIGPSNLNPIPSTIHNGALFGTEQCFADFHGSRHGQG